MVKKTKHYFKKIYTKQTTASGEVKSVSDIAIGDISIGHIGNIDININSVDNNTDYSSDESSHSEEMYLKIRHLVILIAIYQSQNKLKDIKKYLNQYMQIKLNLNSI